MNLCRMGLQARPEMNAPQDGSGDPSYESLPANQTQLFSNSHDKPHQLIQRRTA